MNKINGIEKQYLEKVENVFGDKINTFEIISGIGSDATYGNFVFKINNEWIFRFPKKDIDIKQLKIEIDFLPSRKPRKK